MTENGPCKGTQLKHNTAMFPQVQKGSEGRWCPPEKQMTKIGGQDPFMAVLQCPEECLSYINVLVRSIHPAISGYLKKRVGLAWVGACLLACLLAC